MKTLIYLLSLLVFLNLFGHSAKYEKAVLKGKAMLEQSDSIPDYINVANYFERIAKNEPNEWLPIYYQAQAKMIIGNKLQGQEKENYYQEALAKIETIPTAEKNAEVLALKGYIHMMRISADPATLGQSLSPVVFGLFRKAINLDRTNPRALLFMGQMEYGTAQFFGSASDKACEYISKANQMFSKEENLTIYPNWGAQSAIYSAKVCVE